MKAMWTFAEQSLGLCRGQHFEFAESRKAGKLRATLWVWFLSRQSLERRVVSANCSTSSSFVRQINDARCSSFMADLTTEFIHQMCHVMFVTVCSSALILSHGGVVTHVSGNEDGDRPTNTKAPLSWSGQRRMCSLVHI